MKYTIRKKTLSQGVKSADYYLFYSVGGRRKSVNLGVSHKDIADRKASKIIEELEWDSSGIPGRSRLIKESSAKPILEHLEEFSQNKLKEGCEPQYVNDLNNYIKTVCNDCKWRFLKDVDSNKFVLWRSSQHKRKGKTLNEYLAGWKGFFSWLKSMGRVLENPFLSVMSCLSWKSDFAMKA
ncbi:MAG: hypothetical protein BWZ03_00203 [bacterium ADurb.BinA186]|nr:MAG: hypothetical protein BWZ03_00203 [bacterium ADurb.BinA186]